MKCVATFLLFVVLLFAGIKMQAQQKVQTIVPQQVIEAGNAFQVQYVATDAAQLVSMQRPEFGADIKLVSGPQIYAGAIFKDGKKTDVQNYSFTLLPLKVGQLIIKGATFIYKDGKQTSSDAYVQVIKAVVQSGLQKGFTNVELYGNNAATLKNQLFVEASVNKKECFVGEPIVATFKLFSRVPSTSEVIKNPGFYGFSVVDVPQPDDGLQTLETRNGNMYTAHLLRKVQLYAAQAGKLVVDDMMVQNTINLIDNENHILSKAEHELATKPITINVKALPAAQANFNGAVGNFTIKANLVKDTLLQNATGKLEVVIEGAGNFLQVDAPEITWPKGIEQVEANVAQNLDAANVPVSGSRKYTYSFSSDTTGVFTIPPVSFTYFNPADKNFHSQSTTALQLVVKPFHQPRHFFFSKSGGKASRRNIGAAVFVALLIGFVIFVYTRKGKIKNAQKGFENVEQSFAERIESIDENSDKKYAQLLQVLQDFLKEKYDITHFAKPAIAAGLTQKGFENVAIEKLLFVLNECEVVQYYGAAPTVTFSELKQKAIELVQKGF